MVKVGVVGLGFMGSMHYRCWHAMEGAKIVAACDVEQDKLDGSAGTAGNIAGAENALDMTGVSTYKDIDKMLAECELDAVSIALPTYLHAENAIKALEAGVNVLCEKPMALNVEECSKMIAAAEKAGKILQVGHCIRFWPEYAKTKELIDSGKYGKVIAATFHRLSSTPKWSWRNWILDGSLSGAGAFDLHIHDADLVQYWFGMPKGVFSRGADVLSEEVDHIATQYLYDDGPVVTAEGGWVMADSFGFQMSFHVVLEKATIVFDCTRDPSFKVCPADGEAFTPEVAGGDGYSQEIAYFAARVAGESMPDVLTPQQSQASVELLAAEKQSVRSGGVVNLV